MFGSVCQSLNGFQSIDKNGSLRGASPIGFWFPIMNTEIKEANDEEGQDGRGVVHEEHHSDTEDTSYHHIYQRVCF